MIINFLMNDVSYMDYETQTAHWGWNPTDTRLGGTEESVVRWADELTKRGHEVHVYHNNNDKPWAKNYHPREYYQGGGDICINIKNSEIKPLEPTLYLTNETDATNHDLSPYLGVIWPSNWAKDNIPVNNPNIYIVPHGYDDKNIYQTPSTLSHKKNKQCLYASSPDRGLQVLEQIWPSVVARHPDAHLYVTYGGSINTPNTTCGEFSEDEMNSLYMTSDLWLHPCTGGELFGISGIKAQAAGTIPVYFPTMALGETIQEGVPCIDERDMYRKLCELLDDHVEKKKIRRKLAKLTLPNWRTSTDALESVIVKALCK